MSQVQTIKLHKNGPDDKLFLAVEHMLKMRQRKRVGNVQVNFAEGGGVSNVNVNLTCRKGTDFPVLAEPD